MTRWWAVAGDPVAHSRSPELFAHFGDVHYLRLGARSASHALSWGRRLGLSGLNLTSPFKAAVDLVETDPVAAAVGAINTVTWEGAIARGHNTDVEGVRHALAGVTVAGRRALILGAGGAAEAAAVALIGAGADVGVCARRDDAAQALAQRHRVTAHRWMERDAAARRAGLIIDARSGGGDCLSPTLWRRDHVLLCARYASPQPHLAAARSAGARILDPLDWLFAQGAAAWRLGAPDAPIPAAAPWRGVAPPTAARPHVALIGLAGAGKTTVGAALAERLGRAHHDLDRIICDAAGATVADIFATESEAGFRAREADALAWSLRQAPAVMSCGGGTITHPGSAQLLRQHAWCVWLWIDPTTAAARLSPGSGRPLLGEDPAGALARLDVQRREDYAQTSDLVIDATDSPAAIAERIVREMDHARIG